MFEQIKAVWRYRAFIHGSVKREFQSKYRSSMLGAAWAVINPLAMIVVYTVIFSQVMRAKLPGIDSQFSYSIYLCAGLLTWGLFSETVGRAQNMFLENANLLKKISFPKLCLPMIVVVYATINFIIIFGLFTLFLLLSGNFPGLPFLAILPILLIQTVFTIGLGVCLGVLNVFFRDVGQLFGILLQFWFWATPIVYPISILPERVQPWMKLNPMYHFTDAYHTVLVRAQWPDLFSLWPVVLLSIVLCGLGLKLFRKHGGEMVDEL